MKGLDLLTGSNAFQRDQARLDAKQRAIYKKQGLELPEDGETITNILADNITIEDKPKAATNGKMSPWVAAMLTATGLSAGAAGMALLGNGEDKPAPPTVVQPETLYELHLLD